MLYELNSFGKSLTFQLLWTHFNVEQSVSHPIVALFIPRKNEEIFGIQNGNRWICWNHSVRQFDLQIWVLKMLLLNYNRRSKKLYAIGRHILSKSFDSIEFKWISENNNKLRILLLCKNRVFAYKHCMQMGHYCVVTTFDVVNILADSKYCMMWSICIRFNIRAKISPMVIDIFFFVIHDNIISYLLD